MRYKLLTLFIGLIFIVPAAALAVGVGVFYNPGITSLDNAEFSSIGFGVKAWYPVMPMVEAQAHFSYNKYPIENTSANYSIMQFGFGANIGKEIGMIHPYGSVGAGYYSPEVNGTEQANTDPSFGIYFGGGLRFMRLGPVKLDINPQLNVIFAEGGTAASIDFRVGVAAEF
ncbi:MAG: outer membrane beta-barrel protein [bacterium]|nr:outer membrane beta-barrel protein [bacterium]